MISVALIGDTGFKEFAPLVRWLRSESASVTTSVYADISAWLSAEAVQPHRHRLTVVLQASSDQFASKDVEHLIGTTMYSGLLCCFGVWCEGDGRTRRVWPNSVRVPARYARQLIQRELRRVEENRPPLPPTAARDEIFLYRESEEPLRGADRIRRGAALVISPDRVYRSTLAQVLNASGWDAASAGLDRDSLTHVRSPLLLVHDLDPRCFAVDTSLRRCRKRFPQADIFGLVSMPQQLEIPEDSELRAVIPKLAPEWAVQQMESAMFL